MCRTTNSSFQSSYTLNSAGVWSLIELASLYTVPLSTINGLSCLTTTSNGQARPIRRFLNRSVTFKSNRNGWFKWNQIWSFAGLYLTCVHDVDNNNMGGVMQSVRKLLANFTGCGKWFIRELQNSGLMVSVNHSFSPNMFVNVNRWLCW